MAAVIGRQGGAISLQSITENAQGVHRLLTDEYKHIDARRQAREIYQDGKRLVIGEVQNKPLFAEIVFPVMDELGKTLCLGKIQLQFPLLYSLSKAYRIFLELTWHQCLRDRQPIRADAIAKIQKIIHDTMLTIPITSPAHRFELKCAKEASKWFVPSEGIYGKYLTHFKDAAGGAFNLQAGKILSSLKNLFASVREDLKHSWYIDAYIWRWMSEEVTTIQELQDTMSSAQANEYIEKGGRHAVCITLIFMKIIKNQGASQELKNLALFGAHNYSGLKGILDKKSPNDVRNLLSHPLETCKKIARKPDRFWSARYLVIQYLKRLATKEKYTSFSEASRSLLNHRTVVSAYRQCYQEEYAILASTLREIEKDKKTKSEEVAVYQKQIEELKANQGLFPNIQAQLEAQRALSAAEKQHADYVEKGECVTNCRDYLMELERLEVDAWPTP